MLQRYSFSNESSFLQKLKSFDFVLLFCILIVGIISSFSMYSPDAGAFLYNTKIHIIRFIVFFTMMIF